MVVSRAVPQTAAPSHLFDGRNALIVGASGGIGRAVARALADGGARLMLHGRDPARLARALADDPERDLPDQSLRPESHTGSSVDPPAAQGVSQPVETVICDLPFDAVLDEGRGEAGDSAAPSDASQRLQNVVDVMLKGGVPDILVVGYGPFLERSLLDTTAAQWRALFEANVMLPVMLAQRCLPVMQQRGFGRVLVFGGTGTDRIAGFRTVAAYSAVKTALMSWVKSAAREVGSAGQHANLAVNAICPGYVATEYLSQTTRERYARRIPGGRLATPQQVATAALALLDPGSTLMNGVILPLDGGTRS